MKKFNFTPFQHVLVRDTNEDKWRCGIYSIKEGNVDYCTNGYWSQCIPYEGNEHLYDTTDPYVEPFIPKDGDFVYDETTACRFVYIFREERTDWSNIYHAMYSDSMKTISLKDWCSRSKLLRPATDKERQKLLDALAKDHKRWNAEKKQIEDIYTPQDGDFVFYTYESGEQFISICRDGDKGYVDVKTFGFDAGGDPRYSPEFSADYTQRRPATEDEKKMLLDALHRVGQDWDAERKEIIPYKWKPKLSEIYRTVSFDKGRHGFYATETLWNDSVEDRYNERHGLIFRTEAEAKKEAEQRNKLLE